MSDEKASGGSSKDLSLEQVAVIQHVTIAPAPRTADELAASYAGLQVANMWPEQSEKAVKERIAELVKAGKLKHGKKAADGESTIELAEKQ